MFIGTKAQYIKTAPLLRLMDDRGVDYRLVDSGQHADLSVRLREELEVRTPDVSMGGDGDVESIAEALAWAIRIGRRVFQRGGTIRREVFGGRGGICVVHGDTPTTLISALTARRAGLTVAHLEAGLRSGQVLHPFPEELVRRLVMRIADILFAPHGTARKTLDELRPDGTIVELPANTTVEALRHALGELKAPGDGPALVTTHRVENLTRRGRLRRLVAWVTRIAARESVEFVAHGPTVEALRSTGLEQRLKDAGVPILPLMSHGAFVERLARARYVITDGGSIQEECFYLGVPTLLWRKRTERPEGIGDNVVLSEYEDGKIASFLRAPEEFRRPPVEEDVRPSEAVLDHLLDRLGRR